MTAREKLNPLKGNYLSKMAVEKKEQTCYRNRLKVHWTRVGELRLPTGPSLRIVGEILLAARDIFDETVLVRDPIVPNGAE